MSKLREFVVGCSTTDPAVLASQLESPLRQSVYSVTCFHPRYKISHEILLPAPAFAALDAAQSLDVVKIELQQLVYLCTEHMPENSDTPKGLRSLFNR
jgi:hypothetical protein